MNGDVYARRKEWPLESVTVKLSQQRIHARDCADCAGATDGFVHRIERSVSFAGTLTDEQRTRLQEIAGKCPVHRTLTSQIVVAEKTDTE